MKRCLMPNGSDTPTEAMEAEIQSVAKKFLDLGAPSSLVRLLAREAIAALDAHRAKNGTVPPYMEEDDWCEECEAILPSEDHEAWHVPDKPLYRFSEKEN